MKEIPLVTYQDHLNLLARQSLNSASDYGNYIQESKMLHSLAHLSSTVIFLLDFATKSYPIINHSANSVMGHPKDAFLEGGLNFMLHHHVDFETLNKSIFPNELRLVKENVSINISQFRFSKSYRFKSREGKVQTILQRHSMITGNDKTLPVAIFGFAWNITGHAEQGKLAHQVEAYDPESHDWKLLLSNEYYPDVDNGKLLSKREIEILKWSVEGTSSKQIADKLYISFNTVNTHRRNMLRKTNCQNSMELLRYAIENKFL